MITSPSFPLFLDLVAAGPQPRRVIELGTRRYGAETTSRKAVVLSSVPGGEHLGVDFEAGLDVDQVADAHRLADTFPEGHFAGCLIESVLEHCLRPWVVAEQLARVIRPGGHVLASAPFALAYHGYPHDYWRFTDRALEILFEPWFDTVHKATWLPAIVVPVHNEISKHGAWNYEGKAWLVSHGVFRRR